MKSFHAQFDGRIDATDGSVVLMENEYNAIQKEAFDAGVKVGADKLLEKIQDEISGA